MHKPNEGAADSWNFLDNLPRQFTFIRPLGAGGMGVVYQVFDTKHGQPVALKTLQSLTPALLYRFKHEFRSLADVSHPNLVSLYELMSAGKAWFYTMEYVEGEDIISWLRGRPSNNGIPWSSVREAIGQLATGVAALHRAGKLHRDIKPSNTLVTAAGVVKILDFGLAAEFGPGQRHESTHQHMLGTALYMSPEQAAGIRSTPASDWYGVGVVLYQALSGRLPFEGDALQVLSAKKQFDAPPVQPLAPDAPADLCELCMRLLARDPAMRPRGEETLLGVFKQLNQSSTGGASLAPGQPPTATRSEESLALVGREKELAALCESFELLKFDRRSVVTLVAGYSGEGKSALLDAFLTTLDDIGSAIVLRGRCYHQESTPFKAFDPLIDSLSHYLSQLSRERVEAVLPRDVGPLLALFPVLQRLPALAAAPRRTAKAADGQEMRRRAFAGLKEMFGRLSDRQNLVLAIDDLQWGDAESAELLCELLSPPDPASLMFLGAYRADEAAGSAFLSALSERRLEEMADVAHRRVVLAPLPWRQSLDLATRLLAERKIHDPQQAERIARDSGGNPFFIFQVATESDPGDRLAPVADSGQPESRQAILDRWLWRRASSLSEEHRRLLETVTVAGQPMILPEAFAAAELAEAGLGAVNRLASARLLRILRPGDDVQVDCYHDRIREAVVANLPAERTRGRHLAIAEVLSRRVGDASGASPDLPYLLALHYDGAGRSDLALPHALTAADEARRKYALAVAKRYYAIAAKGAAVSDSASKFRIAFGLGEVFLFLGRYREARVELEQALEAAEGKYQQALALEQLAGLSFREGDMHQTLARCEQGLMLFGARLPRQRLNLALLMSKEVAVQALHTVFPKWFIGRKPANDDPEEFPIIRLIWRLGYAWYFAGDSMRSVWWNLKLLNAAERYTANPELGRLYADHAALVGCVPWITRGLSCMEKSRDVWNRLADPWGMAQATNRHAVLLYACSRFRECVEKCRAAEQYFEHSGDQWELNLARLNKAYALYRLGELREAASVCQRTHEAGLALDDSLATSAVLFVWAAATGGQVPEASIRRDLDRPFRGDAMSASAVRMGHGIRLLACGRPSEATEIFLEVLGIIKKAGLENPYAAESPAWLATSYRIAAESAPAGRERQALLKKGKQAARRAVRVAKRFRNTFPQALREQALLEFLDGSSRRAEALLDRAISIAERQEARYELALTRLAKARVLADQAAFEAAQRDLDTLGAADWVNVAFRSAKGDNGSLAKS